MLRRFDEGKELPRGALTSLGAHSREKRRARGVGVCFVVLESNRAELHTIFPLSTKHLSILKLRSEIIFRPFLSLLACGGVFSLERGGSVFLAKFVLDTYKKEEYDKHPNPSKSPANVCRWNLPTSGGPNP